MAKAKGVPAIIHKILTLGVKEVVITDAARGAWCGNEEEVWQMEAYPVKVISKTGAGDVLPAVIWPPNNMTMIYMKLCAGALPTAVESLAISARRWDLWTKEGLEND